MTFNEIEGRPKATLHSFSHTFNNTLRDLGLGIEDRQILLVHSSSQMTKVYTHPNFELALSFVNKLPRPLVADSNKNNNKKIYSHDHACDKDIIDRIDRKFYRCRTLRIYLNETIKGKTN